MPSLQCPECRQELLPDNLVSRAEHLICGRCGREIYTQISPDAKRKCPKCGETRAGKEFVLAESCCED